MSLESNRPTSEIFADMDRKVSNFQLDPKDHLETEVQRSLGLVDNPLPSKEGNQP